MHRRNPLERGYALLSYSDIVLNAKHNQTDAIFIIRNHLTHERNNWVRVYGIESLAQLGDMEPLQWLYQHLSDDNAQIRRAAILCCKLFFLQMDSDRLKTTLCEQ